MKIFRKYIKRHNVTDWRYDLFISNKSHDSAPKKSRLLIFTFTILVLTFPARADVGTLEDTFVRAYISNPRLLAARAQLRQTNEKAPQARAGWRPTVIISSSVGGTHVKTTQNGIQTLSRSSLPRSNALQITQPIELFGKVEAKVSTADFTIQAQRAALFKTEQDVFLATANAFLSNIRESATLDLQTKNLTRLLKQLEVTEARFKVNDLTRTDMAQAEARVAEAQANVRNAKAQLSQARETFKQVVGDYPTILALPKLPNGLTASQAEAVTAALNQNFSLLQALFLEKAAASQLEEAKRDLLPSVNLVTSVNHSLDSGGGDNENLNLSATIQLSIPLYQAGTEYARIREARENLRRLRFSRQDQERGTSQSAANAFESLQSNLTQLDSLSAQIKAATIALDGVENEAKVGGRTVIDILDAKQALLDAQVKEVQANHNVLVAAYQLLAATGRLTAQNMNLPVAYYDYDAHYQDIKNRWYGMTSVDMQSSNR
jgi:outer membrane protein